MIEKKITKTQARKAKKILDEFNRKLNRKFIKDFTCICCKTRKIRPLDGYGLDYGSIYPEKQHEGIWSDGCVELFSPGYGSKFDTNSFFAAICDPCIEELYQNNLVVNHRDLRKRLKPHML